LTGWQGPQLVAAHFVPPTEFWWRGFLR
jgi:hypothetical protein